MPRYRRASGRGGLRARLLTAFLLLGGCAAFFFVGLYWVGPLVHPTAGTVSPDSEPVASSGALEAPAPVVPRVEERAPVREAPPPAPGVAPPEQPPAPSGLPEGAAATRRPSEPAAGDEGVASGAVRPPENGTVSVRPVPPSAGGERVVVRPIPPPPGSPASGGAAGEAPAAGSSASEAGSGADGVLPLSPVGAAVAPESAVLYRVEVGAPETRQESERLAAELRESGFPATVVVEGGLHRVQAGAFRSRRNAERLATELGSKGFAATIAGSSGE